MSKANNYRALFANPKTRVVIIVTCSVLVGVVGYTFMSSKSRTVSGDAAGAASVPNTPTVNSLPGTSTSPTYNELQNKSNAEKVEKDKQEGNTSLPVLTNNTNIDKTDPFDALNSGDVKPKEVTAAPEPVAPPVVQVQPIQQPAIQQPVQQQRATAQASPNNIQRVEQQVLGYMKLWGPQDSFQEYNYTAQKKNTGENNNVQNTNGTVNTAGQSQVAANVSQNNTNKPQGGATGPAFVRAGTIVPAVMLTSINSDEPGPVVAEIVTGPLKGARVIGQMKSSDQKVVVQFNTLSMPGAPKSYRIDTFAVDPESSRTAIASDVNNHYFLRYGLQLAAAFITGYGQAVSNMGSTTTTNAFGGTTTTYDQLNHKQITESAFGKVGETLGQNIKQDANRAPTVTVDGGTAIGLLFMSDF